MPTNVVMPQMGESVAEGTIVRWIKKVGDLIDRDEPLFEISTDKVDAEIPSPGEGVLLEIRVNEGETVPVDSVVAVIGEPDSAGVHPAATTAAPPAPPAPDRPVVSAEAPRAATTVSTSGAPAPAPGTERSSPVVRRLAREHRIDISQIKGTGNAGRVTKQDVLGYLERRRLPGVDTPRQAPTPVKTVFAPGEAIRIEKMSVMRKKIAEHMVVSVRTSPHVYSVCEVDFHHVDQLRARQKAAYESAGTRLTYTAFIARAVLETIGEFPFVNASIDGDNVVYKRDVGLGLAVALDAGLIVPVIKEAGRRSMRELCRAIQDLAQRARGKQLKPDEVQGGTFTITNPGVFGALFGLPIINQPQVAILAVGAVEKRVVVVDDMIAIRARCYLALGHDHRLIDGADAGRFLQRLKDHLEHFDESWL